MAVKNSLTQSKQKMNIAVYMSQDAVQAQLNGIVKDSKTFITGVVSAVQANPALQNCTKQSIISAALLGESLKLSPSPQLGHYYMVPFRNNRIGEDEAQFIIGWKGYFQLAIRSGQYKRINAVAIKDGELLSYDPLEETISVRLIEDEEVRENTPTIGYYASFEYLNGFRKSLYWSKKKMEAHALKYSKGYAAKKGYTFWEKDFDAMALKTMLRQLISKYGIMSIELQKAYESDMAVIRDDGTPDYVETEYVEQPQQEAPAPEPEAPASQEEPKTMDAAAALFGNK